LETCPIIGDRGVWFLYVYISRAVHAADEMCAKSPASTSTAVDFVAALLASLESLSTSSDDAVGPGKKDMISEDYVRKLNELYPSVSSADYEGQSKDEKNGESGSNIGAIRLVLTPSFLKPGWS
jgi:hypothetical protein